MQNLFPVCPYFSGCWNYIGSFTPSPRHYYEEHQNRLFYALVFLKTASIEYCCEGVKFESVPGDVVFLPQGLDYSNRFTCPGECLVINFTVSNPEEFTPPMSRIRLHSPKATQEKFEHFIYEYQFKGPGYELRIAELFYSILHTIQKESIIGYQSYRKIKSIQPSVAYIEKNFCEPELTVKKIASISHMGEINFRKLFNELYQVSPLQYVLNLKIEKAKDLLVNSSQNISEIAKSCGFNDVFYFSKLFRKKTGYAPSEYRNSIDF